MPSRALFAVAISTARNELTNADGLAIVGTEWNHILDFGEIQEDLAAKLTDGDIRSVLLSLDAVNRLTRVMLTGCIKITGAGLEPLRGSLVIEHIDLSSTKTSISFYRVLPILDSIIEQERCALKHLEFSLVWRSRKFPSATPFQQFLLRYNQMWARRQNLLSCFKCSAGLPQRDENHGQIMWPPQPPRWVHDVGGPWIQTEGRFWNSRWGTDMYTCYKCLKHYCRDCEMLGYCDKCDKVYCADCDVLPIQGCQACGDEKSCINCAPKEQICGDCGAFYCESDYNPCDSCGDFCNICSDSDEAAIICEECNERLCVGCRSQSRSKEINCCSSCPEHEAYCNGCRVECRYLSTTDCKECAGLARIHLLEEKIGGLTKKNEELTKKNKELTDINEQLRGKMKRIRKIEGKTEQHE